MTFVDRHINVRNGVLVVVWAVMWVLAVVFRNHAWMGQASCFAMLFAAAALALCSV